MSASEDAQELSYITKGSKHEKANVVVQKAVKKYYMPDGKLHARLSEGPVSVTLRSHPAKPWKAGGRSIRTKGKKLAPEEASQIDESLWAEDEEGQRVPPAYRVTINLQAWEGMAAATRLAWADCALAHIVEGPPDFDGHFSVLGRHGSFCDELTQVEAYYKQGTLPMHIPDDDEDEEELPLDEAGDEPE